jgi:hypothetical protein
VLAGAITGPVVTFWFIGGIAGRSYHPVVRHSMRHDNFERLFRLAINPALSLYPPPPPANPDFNLDNFFYAFAA